MPIWEASAMTWFPSFKHIRTTKESNVRRESSSVYEMLNSSPSAIELQAFASIRDMLTWQSWINHGIGMNNTSLFVFLVFLTGCIAAFPVQFFSTKTVGLDIWNGQDLHSNHLLENLHNVSLCINVCGVSWNTDGFMSCQTNSSTMLSSAASLCLSVMLGWLSFWEWVAIASGQHRLVVRTYGIAVNALDSDRNWGHLLNQ